MQRLFVFGFVLGSAGLAGCSSKGLVPVEGRVTFAGKAPPSVGYLFFVPREFSINELQDKTGAFPGSALFASDGAFRATTFTDGDGLRPGTYEVRIECFKPPATAFDPDKPSKAPAISLVPKAFSPPDLVVPASGPRPVRYDIDVTAGK